MSIEGILLYLAGLATGWYLTRKSYKAKIKDLKDKMLLIEKTNDVLFKNVQELLSTIKWLRFIFKEK